MDHHTPDTPLKQCNRKDECVHPLGSWLPATLEYFHAAATRDGLRGDCKECRKAYARDYHRANRDAIIPKMREKYIQNKPAYQERSRQRRKTHSAEDDRRIKEWVKANPERRKIHKSRYASSEKGQADHARRRARKKELPDTFTGEEWAHCLEWWGNCCAYCDCHQSTQKRALAADHYIPLINDLSPGTTASNLVPACQSCNSSKNDSLPEEWLRRKFPDHAHEILARIEAYFRSL